MGVFSTLISLVLTVNRIFLALSIFSYSTKMSKYCGFNSQFLKTAGAKAPNTPLFGPWLLSKHRELKLDGAIGHFAEPL